MKNKTITGLLELDVTQSSYGENVYTVELFNSSNESLYSQMAEFIGEEVKLTIEIIPSKAKEKVYGNS